MVKENVLREMNQTQKDKYCVFTNVRCLEETNPYMLKEEKL